MRAFIIYDGQGSVVGMVKAHLEDAVEISSRDPGLLVAEVQETGDLRALSALQDEKSAIEAVRAYKVEVEHRLSRK